MQAHHPSAKVPRELWLTSLRQDLGVTRSQNSEYNSGASRSVSRASTTPEYLKEAFGMRKPKHSRLAKNGYVPGTPNYKEREDMYDEIIKLKKVIQAHKTENDVTKTKLRRSEEENSKKEKHIEQLLDPSKSSEYTRSLVDKNNVNGIVRGLKQKILKLEQQCREKENSLNKLQTDLKTSDIEEMRITMETYYEEIQRLRLLLSAEKKDPAESRESQKLLNSTRLRLSKTIKLLQEENKTLKMDLDRVLSNSPATSTARGYSEWSKQRLVRRVLELERKAEEQELGWSKLVGGGRNMEGQLPVLDCAAERPEQRESCLQQESHHFRGLVKKLKDDRRELQAQLASKDAEVKKLIQEKSELGKVLERLTLQVDQTSEQTREEVWGLTERVKQLEATQEEKQREKGDGVGKKEDTDWDSEATATIQAALQGHRARQRQLSARGDTHATHPKEPNSTSSLHNKSPSASPSNSTQRLISAQVEDEEAITFIQSSLRGHLSRRERLTQSNTGKAQPTPSTQQAKEAPDVASRSSKARSRPAYLDFHKGDEDSDEIPEECFEIEDKEEMESVRKLNLSANRPPLERSSYGRAEDVDSDNSDDLVIVSLKSQDSNF
ncbi:IQ domain-containing protein E [Callorhinchus milii]|uniref:IQ domain-containing protein E n=1 Tax=Callorhinchus milii TaxID=7868 RepID=UPI001C3FB835|nr:IQ domain-containing protein E [Callorhinchus milii]